MSIKLTEDEKRNEEVESWQCCFSKEKFWILFERMNKNKLGFRDFLVEVSKLKDQYDAEQKIHRYFRDYGIKAIDRIYDLAKDDGLAKCLVDRIKEIFENVSKDVIDKLTTKPKP